MQLQYANEVPAPPAEWSSRSQGEIPVVIRLVHEDGSEEWWPGRAVRWSADAVLVSREVAPGDAESVEYTWLPVGDVARVLRKGAEAG